jgi:hypothetical protein
MKSTNMKQSQLEIPTILGCNLSDFDIFIKPRIYGILYVGRVHIIYVYNFSRIFWIFKIMFSPFGK